jgi:hypothetical protein
MNNSGLNTTFILSVISLLLAATASACGLFIPNLYYDNEFVQTAWRGNDWVTLLAVIPLFSFIIFTGKSHSIKYRLIWMGLLGYLFYNYAFYLFGAVFNKLFLVYVMIFSVSFFALITGLSSLPVQTIITTSKNVRWVSAYLLLISVMLCIVELPPCISFITKGELPEIIVKTNHPTSVVYALDLAFIVPAMLLASFLVWNSKSWGVVLAAMMLVKGFTYGLVLVVGTILLALKNINDPLLPVWIFITAGGLIGLWFLFKQINTQVKHE